MPVLIVDALIGVLNYITYSGVITRARSMLARFAKFVMGK